MAILLAVAFASVIALKASFDAEVTLAEWAGSADAICGPALVEQRRLGERLEAAGAAGEPAAVFRRSAAVLRERAVLAQATVDRVEALARPFALTDGEIPGWLAAERRRATLTAKLADAYEERDDARIAQLTGQADRRAEASLGQARALKLKVCARRAEE